MTPTTIRIDSDTRYQKVHHFGASAAWWAQAVGSWDESTRADLLDRLFDPERGIGLDLIRYNLGGGVEEAVIDDPLRKAACIETESGDFDWKRDEAAVEIVNGAVQRGAEVVVFSNSPPARLTVTGAPTGNGSDSNLIPGGEKEFAVFLVNAVEYLAAEQGWPIADISPINEPQWDWAPKNGQEGCHWTPDEAYRMTRALYDEIKKRGLDYSISPIDSWEMKIRTNYQYIKRLFDDDELRKSLSHYAVHSYWSSLYDREDINEYMRENYPEIELWMTEWTEMQPGKDLGMDAALVLASTVHQDMVYTNASSWQYWIAASPYDYRDGLVYIDPEAETFEVSKKLWALGNWSKFVQEGAVRIGCLPPQGESLQASAYKNPDGSTVVVLINGNQHRSRMIRLEGPFPEGAFYEVYETSEEADLDRVYWGNDGTFELKPRSIVTLVVTGE